MRPTQRLLQVLTASPQRPRTIGFIGLGRMGSPMAHNLLERTFIESVGNARFVVCDARTATADAFVADFATEFPRVEVIVASSPADTVLASETVITMLPSTPHVRNVYSEAGGIIPALRSLPPDAVRSTMCIDSTTLDVDVAREVSAAVHSIGATMVDAPVSGGVTGAKAGTLSFLVGGTKVEFGRASPTLTLMGKNIIYCGGSGAGLVAKICNNLVLGVQQIVVAEAMLLGQRLGLDAKVLASVINSSTGACWSSSVNNPVPGALPDKSPPCEQDYEGGFATRLMLKDLGLASDVADSVGSPLALGELAEQIYGDVVREDPELMDKDFSSVYRYLRLAANQRSG
ncbi:3-hydroxyisobutyrate dehydrogenase [Sparassis latifolia]|uniref:3-hydroxyisobutyrate dehydrogenase n=1 Tax=Sparassis crispa TaxID=139825 RepID=A0A401GJP1_9APHY|nr:3-hydroxyisobutyrate dehydrogenase [Sparassis crispa]GBE82381.1 3-hydroxyisobutyrate dehydrogenase [Sparassis crispa]